MRKLRFGQVIRSAVLTGCCAVLLAMVACAASATRTSSPTDIGSSRECLPPLASLSFPVREMIPPDYSPPPVRIPPEWEPQLTSGQAKKLGSPLFDSIVARSADDVWFTTGRDLARYQPSSHRLTFYTVEVGKLGKFVPFSLLLSPTGVLWASGAAQQPDSSYRGFLSYYDPAADKFIYVPELDEFIKGPTPDWMGTDGRGVVWLMDDHTLIRFDPVTRHAEQVDIGNGYKYWAVTVAEDGMLWLAAAKADNLTPDVIRFDYSTRSITAYGSPPGSQDASFGALYFDHSGRLWAKDFGYLEFSPDGTGTWYQIIRSPVFVTEGRTPFDRYAWSRPDKVYESSNGQYWFPGAAGLVSLDFSKGVWCRVSNIEATVTEDDAGDLWIAGSGQIYKYHLQP